MIAQSFNFLTEAFAGVETFWIALLETIEAYEIVIALVVGALIWRLLIMPLMGNTADSDKAHNKKQGKKGD